MLNLHQALLDLAEAYERAVSASGGRSLARVATIVVNRGSFFDRLRQGKTCTLPSFEAFMKWFGQPENWPEGLVPAEAAAVLATFPTDPTSKAA